MRHTITTLAVILALVGPPAAATQMGPNVESAEPFKLGTFENETGVFVGIVLRDQLIAALLLANPTDVYRMLNLTGSDDAALLSGMSGVAGSGAISPSVLVALLATWIIVPFTVACVFFRRRQL